LKPDPQTVVTPSGMEV